MGRGKVTFPRPILLAGSRFPCLQVSLLAGYDVVGFALNPLKNLRT